MEESGIRWRGVIEGKFEMIDFDWYSSAMTRPRGMGMWKKIGIVRDSF